MFWKNSKELFDGKYSSSHKFLEPPLKGSDHPYSYPPSSLLAPIFPGSHRPLWWRGSVFLLCAWFFFAWRWHLLWGMSKSPHWRGRTTSFEVCPNPPIENGWTTSYEVCPNSLEPPLKKASNIRVVWTRTTSFEVCPDFSMYLEKSGVEIVSTFCSKMKRSAVGCLNRYYEF